MPPFPTSSFNSRPRLAFWVKIPRRTGQRLCRRQVQWKLWRLGERLGGRIFAAPKGPIGTVVSLTSQRDTCFFLLWQGAFEKILASWNAERGGEVPAISENIDGYGCFSLNVLLEGANLHTGSLPVGTLLMTVLFSRLWLWACRPLIFVAGATFYASSGSVCVLQWSQLCSCVACGVLGSFRAEQVLYFVAVACFCLRVQERFRWVLRCGTCSTLVAVCVTFWHTCCCCVARAVPGGIPLYMAQLDEAVPPYTSAPTLNPQFPRS